jgi:cation transport protein ChaC
MAFRVKASGWKKTRDLLHARELINDVYRPRFQVVRLHDGRKVSAYIFVADREHIQYWRGSDDDAATLICRGVGSKGKAREYFFRTMEELRKQGIPDKRLIRLQNTILLKDGADQ